MSFLKHSPQRLTGDDKRAIRAQCMKRDDWTCQACGVKVSDAYPEWYALKAHMAHVVSLGAGGADNLSNVECRCLKCHMVGEHQGGKPVRAKG